MYETNFETDFTFPLQIPLEKVREPNDELEANWQRLIGQRYFSVSSKEAERAWGDKRHEYVDQNMGGYTAGFDVFHTLHCINELRKALRPEHYPPKSHALHGALHNDKFLHAMFTISDVLLHYAKLTFLPEHCLEILRQTVQCYGSTTLIPTTFMKGLEHNYIDSDQVHICRSFNFIRNYTSLRMQGKDRYVPRDKSLVDKEKHAVAKAWGKVKGDNKKGGSL
ncbi:hypothetical protein FVEN_g7755 [Fusarium venenatum]|nr:hypothetical protein FVEN_g7755 [Fusarium venenatum]